MRETTRKKLTKNHGITLIALVVTIVVLLILAGVSLNLVIGNNGIINRAKDAKRESVIAYEKDSVGLAYSSANIGNLGDNVTSSQLQDELDKLVGESKTYVTEGEDNKLNIKYTDTEHEYTIEQGEVIKENPSIRNKQITVTSSDQIIEFKQTVTQNDIIGEKSDYSNYTIEGISSTIDGEYIKAGSVAGKTGDLEIIGDITNTTFRYTLNACMNGDEVFYCKINIDGEDYFQNIKVIQGDCVTYEEDFVAMQIEENEEYADWSIEENENYSGGKALVSTVSKNGKRGTKRLTCTFYGRGVEIYGKQFELEYPNFVAMLKDPETGKGKAVIVEMDSESGDVFQSEILEGKWADLRNEEWYVEKMPLEIKIYGVDNDKHEAPNSIVVFDCIKVYR